MRVAAELVQCGVPTNAEKRCTAMPNRTEKSKRRNSGLTGEYKAVGIKAVAAATQFARGTDSPETSSRNEHEPHPHRSHATGREVEGATSEGAVPNNAAERAKKRK
jgi:hypothetical protein